MQNVKGFDINILHYVWI